MVVRISKVQFARIMNGSLVYDEGKDDNFVFEGTGIKRYSYLAIVTVEFKINFEFKRIT